jgi:putative ATPase
MAASQNRAFFSLSAINSGVKDIRDIIDQAKSHRFFAQPNPILFIDEIHRFSKSQQDALLNAVEKGTITLIGATTENPSFEVISALLSRCQVYVLEHLDADDLRLMIDTAIRKDDILSRKKVVIQSYEALIRFSGGDGRRLYNCLELAINQFMPGQDIVINDEVVTRAVQQNLNLYDKACEHHYDTISAFIKSIRSSDPNAAIYYLACMLSAGEDPMFICRRMVILAAEDIGLANPNALLLATSCMQSVHLIGIPEGRIAMSETALYLALSPKSNSAYVAIDEALAFIQKNGVPPVPLHLRNAPTKLMKDIGYGDNYKYSHDHEGHKTLMECLPDSIKGTTFYKPGNNPNEDKYKQLIAQFWMEKYKT